jgi:hypothetical protein
MGLRSQLGFRVVLEHVEKARDNFRNAQRVGLEPLAGQRVQRDVAHEVDRVLQARAKTTMDSSFA